MNCNALLYVLAIGILTGSIIGQTVAGHWVTTCGALLLALAVALSYIRHSKKQR